ncbi:MAG: beta family protein [Dehalococcoidia bacterium]|nr:beta family protein [Dehalococcoidia bacterium]
MGVIAIPNKFDTKHYVPILRWKKAERAALSQLVDGDSARLTPLIELVPDTFVREDRKGHSEKLNSSSVISKVAGQLFQCWERRPFFIDLGNLPEEILYQGPSHSLVVFGEYASNLRLSLIPVIGIHRDDRYKTAVRTVSRKFNQGACLRLTLEDIKRPGLDKAVSDILSFLSITPEEVDLLIDYQGIDGIDSSAPTFTALCSLIPNLQQWRNFIAAGGAFPKDLSGLQKNQKYVLSRNDWIIWRNQTTIKVSSGRMPSYSDYTIQHAYYSKSPGKLRSSASIRYTTDDNWIIMRGEDVFNPDGPRFKQYPDWAILLCDLPEYRGEAYSSGDKYIKEMSQQSTKTGDASTWLQAGINHHMTFVVDQLANLRGS